VTAEKGEQSEGGRRKIGRPKGKGDLPETARGPECERRFVDIDPWAVLLEQLMEVPAEEPAVRKRGKRE
jgi:hypothetical protein